MENHHLLTKRAMASRAVLNYKKILRRGLIHIYIYRESDLVTKGSDLIWTHGMGQAAWGTGTGLAHKDPHGNGPCYICVSAGLPLPSWRFYFFCFYVSMRFNMFQPGLRWFPMTKPYDFKGQASTVAVSQFRWISGEQDFVGRPTRLQTWEVGMLRAAAVGPSKKTPVLNLFHGELLRILRNMMINID